MTHVVPEDPGSSEQIMRRTTKHTPHNSLAHWLIGRPLQTADAPHQTIGKAVGLAVFASDALSSTAYAGQEILVILAAAGTVAFGYIFPISVAIVILLAIVTLSYEQTIHAYPDGGGAYIVARDNLGDIPALMAAAALLTDYVLTVSVSIASGVAQIVSAYAGLFPFRVYIAVGFVLFVMLVNLRGVKESGSAFAVPTYFFVVTMYATVITGLVRYALGTLGVVANPPDMESLGNIAAVTPFLLLHAFASGTTALTGVEAISNGITAFKEPRSKNAGITLMWMAGILGTLFLGISFLARAIQAVPSEEVTVISQLAETVYGGRGIPYLALIAATAVILIMAANTAFADFPRLSALAAKDGFLPRQLTYRGSRLVYSRGIMALAVVASVLIIIFQASGTRLIPLYAIGVFLSFTLSQAGMAHRWWKIGHLKEGEEIVERGSTLRFEPGWQHKMLINGFGSQAAEISTDVPAPQILAGAVATEMRARGYRVEDSGDVPLTVELTAFQHAFHAGFMSHGSEATVSFTARLVDGAGKRLFQGSFTGPFNGSAQTADGDNVRTAYEGALQLAVRKLVDSPELQKALAAAAQPRA